MLNDPSRRIVDSADCADSAEKESEARNSSKKLGAPFFPADSKDSAEKRSDPW